MASQKFTKINKKTNEKTECSFYEVKRVLKENYEDYKDVINALSDNDIIGFETEFYHYEKVNKIIDMKEI